MWKLAFYKIIANVDNYKNISKEDFYQHTDNLYQDILSLQLMLVDSNTNQPTNYSESHLISFALAAYCDEKLNIIAITSRYDYEMLQARLFKTLDAGKLYYEYLEYLLTKRSEALADAYWVYYYLLIHGYKGMYDSENYLERSLYLRQLKILITEYIPQTHILKKTNKYSYKIKNLRNSSFRHFWILPTFCLLGSYIFINYL